jgi:hypothetical protein
MFFRREKPMTKWEPKPLTAGELAELAGDELLKSITQNESQNEAGKAKVRRDRRSVQLNIPRTLCKKFRKRARAEGLPFGSWLVRLAIRELRRKPSL